MHRYSWSVNLRNMYACQGDKLLRYAMYMFQPNDVYQFTSFKLRTVVFHCSSSSYTTKFAFVVDVISLVIVNRVHHSVDISYYNNRPAHFCSRLLHQAQNAFANHDISSLNVTGKTHITLYNTSHLACVSFYVLLHVIETNCSCWRNVPFCGVQARWMYPSISSVSIHTLLVLK